LSQPKNVEDRYGNWWSYHPRSDHHSKVACWGVLFDLLSSCSLLRDHVSAGKVGFGINHEMTDFRQNRKKNFDLVLCTPRSDEYPKEISFASLVAEYGIALTPDERVTLDALPRLIRVRVGSVHVAFEAKACMTEHGKARPRLFDELNSSHLTIHGNADIAIATAFTMVNLATEFTSPERNKFKIGRKRASASIHKQPDMTRRVIEKIREIPRRAGVGTVGFDALAIVVVEAKNDGSRVRLVTEPPAPQLGDIDHYESMIRRVAQVYESRFPRA
jgi:hypothetical protein